MLFRSYVDEYLHRVSRHSIPAPLYQRLKIIPDQGPFGSGYYISFSRKSPDPKDSSFRVKMHFNLDWRVANRFRQDRRKTRSYGEVVVYEKDDINKAAP